MSLLQFAYEWLLPQPLPKEYRSLMRRAEEGFSPSDIRIVKQERTPQGACCLAIVGSDPTPNHEIVGVWGIFALLHNKEEKPLLLLRGDAVLSETAVSRWHHLQKECGGEGSKLSGQDVEKHLRTQLRAAGLQPPAAAEKNRSQAASSSAGSGKEAIPEK